MNDPEEARIHSRAVRRGSQIPLASGSFVVKVLFVISSADCGGFLVSTRKTI
jgi:hypothetical protein